jgi:cobyrinic acid a,c-diamide synthase
MACLIAAPASGSGKTLLSLSLAALARQRNLRLQPFKVGPDYLDPQLLSRVSGLSCRNLDPLLCGEAWLQHSFTWHAGRADLALVEGVMGLFDGRGASSEGSSAAVATLLKLPVVLVVDASRQGNSVAALVRGFRDHGPPQVSLAGVVLNRVGSSRHVDLLREALAGISIPVLGALPRREVLEVPSRHLGLLPPGELDNLETRIDAWAALAEQHLDLQLLWPLLSTPPRAPDGIDPIQWLLSKSSAHGNQKPVQQKASQPLAVAVASDAAFHFRYPEASELLEACGLIPRAWSPLADDPLPPDATAVVLPGGYPELHAAQLASSQRSLAALQTAHATGLPMVAECGGMLLLGQQLGDPQGVRHRMAGLLPFSAAAGPLQLGYRRATALVDGLLVRRGEQLMGHEFHRWALQPMARKENLWQLEGWAIQPRVEGWTKPKVHASWLHLHWAGCPQIPWRLAAEARKVDRLAWNAASEPQTAASAGDC